MRGSFGAVLLFTLWASAASGQQQPDFDRTVSLKLLPSNLLSDQKNIWLSPRRLAHPKNWIAPAAVVIFGRIRARRVAPSCTA